MNGLELLLLGHKLSAIGLDALPHSGFHTMPVSARTILVDVFSHPGSSIKEITERTGFPQSMVSFTVARFKDHQMVTTSADPADRRRTLVSPAPGERERGWRAADRTTVDDALAAELRDADPAELRRIIAALERLAERLVVPPV